MDTAQAVDIRGLVRRGFNAIERPGSEDLERLVHPDFQNWEADGPGAALRGPASFAATIEALNRAFSDIRFEILEVVSEGDLVAVRTVMRGVHTGPMRALEPAGKPFAMSQSHWFRIVDGRVSEHWANRDDLGFLHQVGAAAAPRVGGEAQAVTV